MSWIAKCRGQNAYRQVSRKNKTKLEEATLKQTLTELLSSIHSQIQTHKNTLLFTFPKQPIPTWVCSNFAVSQAENWSQHKSCWEAASCCTKYSKLRWNYDACSATLTLICCHLLLLALDSDACCVPLTLICRPPLLLAFADEWSQRKEFFYATSAKSYKECM
jgi:hypothetical protein